jgi:hypothetical protein
MYSESLWRHAFGRPRAITTKITAKANENMHMYRFQGTQVMICKRKMKTTCRRKWCSIGTYDGSRSSLTRTCPNEMTSRYRRTYTQSVDVFVILFVQRANERTGFRSMTNERTGKEWTWFPCKYWLIICCHNNVYIVNQIYSWWRLLRGVQNSCRRSKH